MERITVTDLTTDASGDATAFTRNVKGKIHSIQYVPDGTSPYDAGADVTITGEDTGQQIWVEANVGGTAKTVAPSIPTHDEVGVASLYAGAGEPVERPIAIAQERIKVVIAQGGNTKIGTFHILIDGASQGGDTTSA